MTYRRKILRYLYQHRSKRATWSKTAPAMADELGVAPNRIYVELRELVASGLVERGERIRPEGKWPGRPPIPHQLSLTDEGVEAVRRGRVRR